MFTAYWITSGSGIWLLNHDSQRASMASNAVWTAVQTQLVKLISDAYLFANKMLHVVQMLSVEQVLFTDRTKCKNLALLTKYGITIYSAWNEPNDIERLY